MCDIDEFDLWALPSPLMQHADDPFGPLESSVADIGRAASAPSGQPLAAAEEGGRAAGALSGQPKKKTPASWGPVSVLKKRLVAVPHTACDCGAATVLHNEPLRWLFCQKCQMSVTQGVRARCKCGRLQPKEKHDRATGRPLPVTWIECDLCGIASHVGCYKNANLDGRFVCRECQVGDGELCYECTACGTKKSSEASIRVHIARHGDAVPITYKAHRKRRRDAKGEDDADDNFDPDAVDDNFDDFD